MISASCKLQLGCNLKATKPPNHFWCNTIVAGCTLQRTSLRIGIIQSRPFSQKFLIAFIPVISEIASQGFVIYVVYVLSLSKSKSFFPTSCNGKISVLLSKHDSRREKPCPSKNFPLHLLLCQVRQIRFERHSRGRFSNSSKDQTHFSDWKSVEN